MAASLFDRVRALLLDAREITDDPALSALISEANARLDEPLRIAIAGRLKAGKSTLLNAWVGERVAATDAGECTKVVTWYRDGQRYRARLFPLAGDPVDVRVDPEAPSPVVVGDWRAEALDHIDVTWPSDQLRRTSLIDTPGMASLSTEVAERTLTFLTPGGEGRPTEADAVIYLMRHVHESDFRFLEAFQDSGLTGQAAVNGVAVLSRADEIGGCTLRSMEVAARVAARWRSDVRLRRLCQTVVPVAGLLAEAGATLREAEFQALRLIASLPVGEQEEMVLTADRFVAGPCAAPVNEDSRRALAARLGLYGVRLSLDLMRRGEVGSSPELAKALVRASGLEQLRATLANQFEMRSRVLKARSALSVLEYVLGQISSPEGRVLSSQVQQVALGAHELVEISYLNRLRAGLITVPERIADEVERLLGGSGASASERLGYPPDAPRDALQAAAEEYCRFYRRFSANPLNSRELNDVAACVIRTCEGLIGQMSSF